MTALIKPSWRDSGYVYGYRKVFGDLRGLGETCSRHRVARLMRINGWRAQVGYRRRPGSYGGSVHTVAPNILDRQFHVAAPNVAWVTDITYVRTHDGWLYLAVVLDLFSRRVVGWSMDSRMTKELVLQALLAAVWRRKPKQTVLVHSDNGAPMKAQTMKAKLEELGVLPSYSRPRVSNDNAFVESLFRVLKYRPRWPSSGFTSLDEARLWVDRFVRWYNTQHRHSKLRFVTPEQRHNGEDTELLKRRQQVLEQAKQRMPSRWGTRPVRNCETVGPVTLNPEKELPMKQAA